MDFHLGVQNSYINIESMQNDILTDNKIDGYNHKSINDIHHDENEIRNLKNRLGIGQFRNGTETIVGTAYLNEFAKAKGINLFSFTEKENETLRFFVKNFTDDITGLNRNNSSIKDKLFRYFSTYAYESPKYYATQYKCLSPEYSHDNEHAETTISNLWKDLCDSVHGKNNNNALSDAYSKNTSYYTPKEITSILADIVKSAGLQDGQKLGDFAVGMGAFVKDYEDKRLNITGIDIDIKKLTEAALGFSIEQNESPQVLIVHTHATESFMSTDSTYYTDDFSPRSKDNSKNMVKIGDIVAEKLNNAGIKTLHDATLHDYPEYTGSYTRSAKTIKSYLSKYPDIKIVLDLHRDSVASGESDKVKLVTEIGGKKAAQVMLVMGSQTGSVTGHPNWQENLKLAFKLQQKLENNYPTLARPLMLMSKLYNQNLTTGSLLLEFGTDANSLEEACYSAELVGNALAELLKE